MAAPSFIPLDDTQQSMHISAPGPVAQPKVACRRPYVALVVAVCALAGFGATAWRRRCAPTFASDSMVSLMELPEDGFELDARRGDEDAVGEWLSTADSAYKAADVGVAPETIQKAMSTDDPKEAERIVKRAMQRALEKTRSDRRELKQLVKSKRHSLKGHTKEKTEHFQKQQDVYTAKCVFDALQAADSIAMAAANLNDKVHTMGGIDNKTLILSHMSKQAAETKVIVGEVNDFYFMDNLAQLAVHLSLAVNDCSTTIAKNVDSLCAASIMSLFASMAQGAGSGSLIALSCRGINQSPPEGAKPSNLGAGLTDRAMPGVVPLGLDRRLQEEASAQEEPELPAAAPPRKLLFGGGYASDGTLCGFQTAEIMWNLAQAALWITQAADGNLGRLGKCSNKHSLGGDLSPTICAVDVTGILFAFAEVARYLELVMVTCTDTLNIPAMCAAGVTGLAGTAAQMAQASAGMHYACDELQKPKGKVAATAAIFGRRLQGKEGDSRYPSMGELRANFSSVEALWKSMGYDLNDKKAPFRQRQRQRAQEREGVQAVKAAELLREDAEASGGLFQGVADCPAA